MIGGFDLNAFFGLLLGAGGVASIKAIGDVLRYFRAGKAMKEQGLVASLSTALERSDSEVEELKEALDFRTDERDYWRNRNGKLEFLLDKAGIVYEAARPLVKRKRKTDES